jgi:hypothetical protein
MEEQQITPFFTQPSKKMSNELHVLTTLPYGRKSHVPMGRLLGWGYMMAKRNICASVGN